MKKVNTYGFKMTGIKTVAGESNRYWRSGRILRIVLRLRHGRSVDGLPI